MMRLERRTKKALFSNWSGWPYLIVLLISFFAGALAGYFFAFLCEPSVLLRSYLMDYFDLAAQGGLHISFLSVVWDCVRWPLLAAVFAFTIVGVLAVPVVFACRGFLLSYTVSNFSLLFGYEGFAASAVLFSVTVLLLLPILFVIGCESFRMACMRIPGAVVSSDKKIRIELLLPGIGATAIAVALQWTILPMLLSAVCERLF